MPIYEYKCKKCDKIIEIIEHVNGLGSIRYICEEDNCGGILKRIISKSQARPQVMDYYSENAGAYFTGPKQKARILKEKGLQEAGDIKLEDFKHG